MKIAVVTDSNSGITQAQAKEMGITVLPMPFMIDGETYYEDITLTQEQFYQRLKDNSDISTVLPSLPRRRLQICGTAYLHRATSRSSTSRCPPDFPDPARLQ